MERFEKILPTAFWEAAAAAAGLLLALYPAAGGFVLVKAASALGIFYALFRLLLALRAPGLPGRWKAFALSAAGLLLGLLFFFRPPLFWVLLTLVLGVVLVLYGLLRIPMIWESRSLGAPGLLAALAWAALPILAGALLLSRLFSVWALLLRIAGALLLFMALVCLVSDSSGNG